MVTVRGDAGEGPFGHVDAEAVRLIDPAGIGDPHRRTGHLAVAQQAAWWSAGLSSVRQSNASRGSQRRSSALSEQGILPR